MKNLLKKITNDEDLHKAGFNLAVAWLAGKVANTVSNAVFHYDLNQYNSVDHFAIGVGLGTFVYRKAGGGIKGALAGLAAGTMFSALWEPFENFYVFKSSKLFNIDTISDIAMVYAGNILSFLAEGAKSKKK